MNVVDGAFYFFRRRSRGVDCWWNVKLASGCSGIDQYASSSALNGIRGAAHNLYQKYFLGMQMVRKKVENVDKLFCLAAQ